MCVDISYDVSSVVLGMETNILIYAMCFAGTQKLNPLNSLCALLLARARDKLSVLIEHPYRVFVSHIY